MSILHWSETQKQLKFPKYLNYIFSSAILLFCFLENATPTVTAQLEGELLENCVHSEKKEKCNAITTLQTTHYIKRESLKQEAEFPKEFLENTPASHMPIWDVKGFAVLFTARREYLTERTRCSLAKTTTVNH